MEYLFCRMPWTMVNRIAEVIVVGHVDTLTKFCPNMPDFFFVVVFFVIFVFQFSDFFFLLLLLLLYKLN